MLEDDKFTTALDPPATELLSPLTDEDDVELLGAVELSKQETSASDAVRARSVSLFMQEFPVGFGNAGNINHGVSQGLSLRLAKIPRRMLLCLHHPKGEP